MRSLPWPDPDDHDDDDFYRVLINAKHKKNRDPLLVIFPELISRFATYRQLKETLEGIDQPNQSITDQRDRLIGLYENRRPLAELLNKVFSRSATVCPSCGEPAVPTTYDHVLPKGGFPEFSVFSLNLMPCCFDCNVQKNDAFIGADGRRVVINPYVDRFLASAVIDCSLSEPYEAPLFTLGVKKSRLSVDARELCRKHIEQLKFQDRFQIFCAGRFYQFWRTLYLGVEQTSFGLDQLQFLIQSQIGASVLTYGPNNWDAVLLRAIASNRKLCRFLLRCAPPKGDNNIRDYIRARTSAR